MLDHDEPTEYEKATSRNPLFGDSSALRRVRAGSPRPAARSHYLQLLAAAFITA
jgi:hypothetical protein